MYQISCVLLLLFLASKYTHIKCLTDITELKKKERKKVQMLYLFHWNFATAHSVSVFCHIIWGSACSVHWNGKNLQISQQQLASWCFQPSQPQPKDRAKTVGNKNSQNHWGQKVYYLYLKKIFFSYHDRSVPLISEYLKTKFLGRRKWNDLYVYFPAP